MNNDPFDRLEDQLRRTVASRRALPQRSRLRHRGTLALILLTLIGGGTAATAGVFHNDKPSAVDRAIGAGFRGAQDDPVCTFRFPARGGKVPTVAGTADQRIAARFAVFARPTRAIDRQTDLQFAALAGVVLRDTVRSVTAADGARFKLAISKGPMKAGQKDPVGCAVAARDAAIRYVPASNVELRARVEKAMDGRVAAARRNSAPTAQQLSFAYQSRFSRANGGGTTLIRDGRVPNVGGYFTDRRAGQPVRTFYGLVPDMVKRVRITDRSTPSDKRLPARSVAVQNNVYDIALPHQMGPQLLMHWLDADGHVVKTLRPGF